MRRRAITLAARLQAAAEASQAMQPLLSSAAPSAAVRASAASPLLGRAALHGAASPASAAHLLRQQQQQQRAVGLAALLPTVATQQAACLWRAPAAAGAGASAAGSAGGARRGYAQLGTRMPKQGYNAPVEMQRNMQLRTTMISSNLLAEPYRGVLPRQPLAAFFGTEGWKELWRRFVGNFKSLYTLAKCKKHVPGFERKAFKGEALALYKEICGLLAAGDKSALRQLVSPAIFSDMKRQLKQREDGGWARVHWEMVQEPTVDQVMTVQGRMILIDPKDTTSGFAQLTVRIPSSQRFAAFDRSGRLVAGSLEQAVDVEDYWVFEHALQAFPANRWRLAGRLSILPHAAEQKAEAPAATAAAEKRQQPAAAAQQQQQQEAAPAEGAAQQAQQQPAYAAANWKAAGAQQRRKAAAARGGRGKR